MHVKVFTSPSDFLDRTLDNLEKNEAANNLIIGLGFRLIHEPDFYLQKPFLATVEDGRSVVLAALMTPPHNLILTAFRPDFAGALPALCESLRAGIWFLPGVIAPKHISTAFAAAWSEYSGYQIARGQSMRVYELHKVIPLPRIAQGSIRLAVADDLDLAASWLAEFTLEALGKDDPDGSRRNAEFKIRSQELYFWEDQLVVSMASAVRPTRHGIVIGSVYTPPAARARGYASALVAALSQRMLDQGYRFTCLFTDLANPTSNKIYQDVGYKPLEDFQEFRFTQLLKRA